MLPCQLNRFLRNFIVNYSLKTLKKVLDEMVHTPDASSNQIACRTGLSHPTVSKYRTILPKDKDALRELMFKPDYELRNMLIELAAGCEDDDKVEPDLDAAFKFVHGPRSYFGKGRRTLEEAFLETYVKVEFPECVKEDEHGQTVITRQLPSRAVSFTTFKRRFKEYRVWRLKAMDNALLSTTPSLNECGPGGCFLIDGIGYELKFIDSQGVINDCYAMAGTSLFSGVVFAKAYEDKSKHTWLCFIEDMLYKFGGAPSSLKSDNDSSFCKRIKLHGVKGDRGFRHVPLKEVIWLGEMYGFEPVLSGIGRPRHKALTERMNLEVERFMDKLPRIPGTNLIPANNLEEINKLLNDISEQINNKVLEQFGMSRREYFEKYEAPYLKPLPPEEERLSARPDVKTVVIGVRGYARYKNVEYYLGTGLSGHSVICMEKDGSVTFVDFKTNHKLDTYEIPTKPHISVLRLKHKKYFTPAELYVSRTLPSFLKMAKLQPLLTEELTAAFNAVFADPNLAQIDKAAAANEINKLCELYVTTKCQTIKKALRELTSVPNPKAMDIKYGLIKAISDSSASEVIPTKGLRGPGYYK